MNKFTYFKVYKPYRVLSQFTDTSGRTTLKDLFKFPQGVYPVGRLDFDSEGLLLLTDDKKLNSLLAHPLSNTQKEYLVQVEGIPGEADLNKLREGILIDKKTTLPAEAGLIDIPADIPPRDPPIRYRKNIPDSWIRVIITEGRNRQVRKMAAGIGFPALRLIRIRIKNIRITGMKPGEVRELSSDEVTSLIGTYQNSEGKIFKQK